MWTDRIERKGIEIASRHVSEGEGKGTYILLTILLRASGWSWVRQSPPAGAAALGSTPPAAATAAGSAPCVGRQLAAPSMACGPAACLALSLLEFDWWIGRICWATKDRRLLYGEQQLQEEEESRRAGGEKKLRKATRRE